MCPNVTTPATKRCSHCKQDKPLSDFSRNKSKTDGLQHQCKACNRLSWVARSERSIERKRELYYVNQKAHIERNRAYREVNAKRLKEYDRARSKKRAIWKTEYDHKYRNDNRQRISANANARSRQWRANNPEKARAITERRRARRLSAQGDYTEVDVRLQYQRQSGRCYYCHVKVGIRYHVDHVIPLSRGGTNSPENLVIACPTCNQSKGNKLPHEWVQGGRLL